MPLGPTSLPPPPLGPPPGPPSGFPRDPPSGPFAPPPFGWMPLVDQAYAVIEKMERRKDG
jgi:hypothetical protein